MAMLATGTPPNTVERFMELISPGKAEPSPPWGFSQRWTRCKVGPIKSMGYSGQHRRYI